MSNPSKLRSGGIAALVALSASLGSVVLAPTALAADATVDCGNGRVPGLQNMSVAQTIANVAGAMRVSDKVRLAAFETAIVESNVNNCRNGDLDSVGVFQQRAGWGTVDERQTVSKAATKFLQTAVSKEPQNPRESAGALAQRVQVSAHPSRYDTQEGLARTLIARTSGALSTPVSSNITVGASAAPDGSGGWSVTSRGVVKTWGTTAHYGDLNGRSLNQPVVAMVSSRSGKGYWLVAADGGIFAFGDAGFYGSMGGRPLNQPVVGMTSTATGGGYWLVAADGGIFAFGDAGFYGSMGGTRLNQPVVGMEATGSGRGYWLVAADGGVFCFGDAPFRGSAVGNGNQASALTRNGAGYSIVLQDGRVLTY